MEWPDLIVLSRECAQGTDRFRFIFVSERVVMLGMLLKMEAHMNEFHTAERLEQVSSGMTIALLIII